MDLSYKKVEKLRKIINDKIAEIEVQINSISKPISLPNQEYERLLENKRILVTFISSEIDKIYMFKLEEYPERLLSIYDSVPIISQNKLLILKLDLNEFTEEMRLLKTEKKVIDKYRWIKELDQA